MTHIFLCSLALIALTSFFVAFVLFIYAILTVGKLSDEAMDATAIAAFPHLADGAPEVMFDKTPRGQRIAKRKRGGSAHDRRVQRRALERVNAL